MSLFIPAQVAICKPASAAAWSPADLSDLYMWFDAQDSGTITKDGSNYVTQWNDKKNGYNVTATGTNGPVWGSSAMNSRAGLTFGATSKLSFPNGGLDFLRAQDQVTVVMVAEHITRTASRSFWWFARADSATYARLCYYDYASGRINILLRQQDADSLWQGQSSATSVVPEDTVCIHRLCMDIPARYAYLYVNTHGDTTNIGPTTQFPDTDTWPDTRSIGGGFGNTGSSSSTDFKLGEILFLRDALTSTEITNLNSYLKNKWGIS